MHLTMCQSQSYHATAFINIVVQYSFKTTRFSDPFLRQQARFLSADYAKLLDLSVPFESPLILEGGWTRFK